MSSSDYLPKGLVKIFPHGPPSSTVFYTIAYAAIVSTWFSIVGFLGRLSTITSAVTVTFLISLDASWGPYWSHAFNVQLLAALVFMFGRSTDVLSVDALIRKFRGKELRISNQAIYWWPVIGAELATHFFMLGAFYQKFHIHGYWWSLSDNIRNALSISWYTYRDAPPELTQLLMSHPLFYKTAGTLQLVAQFTTIWSAFLVALPRVRLLIGGVLFIIEIFALNLIFNFWHPFWIPLAFLSFDWEWMYKEYQSSRLHKIVVKVSEKLPQLSETVRSLFSINEMNDGSKNSGSTYTMRLPSLRYMMILVLFFLSFFGYYIATILFRLGESHLNYPFSSMGFYSDVKASQPYNKHLYWPYYRGYVEVIKKGSKKPIDVARQFSTYGEMWRDESMSALKEDLFTIKRNITSENPYYYVRVNNKLKAVSVKKPHIIKLYKIIAAVPPYPKKPNPVFAHMGLKGMLIDERFYAARGRVSWEPKFKKMSLTINSTGFENPSYELLYRVNVREDVKTDPLTKTLKPLPGKWVGDKFMIDNKTRPDFFYTIIKVTDAKTNNSYLFYGPDNFEDHA